MLVALSALTAILAKDCIQQRGLNPRYAVSTLYTGQRLDLVDYYLPAAVSPVALKHLANRVCPVMGLQLAVFRFFCLDIPSYTYPLIAFTKEPV